MDVYYFLYVCVFFLLGLFFLSFLPGMESHVAEDDFELLLFWCLPQVCWSDKCVSLHPASVVPGMEPRASCNLPAEPHFQLQNQVLQLVFKVC